MTEPTRTTADDWIIRVRFGATEAAAHDLQNAVMDLITGRDGVTEAVVGLQRDDLLEIEVDR